MVGRWRVVSCVHLLHDVEVYQVRDGRNRYAALKIVRNPRSSAVALLKNERATLSKLAGGPPHLKQSRATGRNASSRQRGRHQWNALVGKDPGIAPRLIDSGVHERRPYLVTAWRNGTDAGTAAFECRQAPPEERASRLGVLLASIAAAYADLHDHGVLHGDVHTKNIRVAADGSITLLDFGWSRRGRGRARRGARGRAGAGIAYEPEYARAVLAGRAPPVLTARAEQFNVASLLYQLWTGSMYRRFSLNVDRAFRQVALEPPRSFRSVRATPHPQIEAVLRRALTKEPSRRFPSMRTMARALARATAQNGAPTPNANGRHALVRLSPVVPSTAALNHKQALTNGSPTADALLAVLRLTGPEAIDMIPRSPTCSLASGAAGVAYALARIATLRNDPQSLAWADVWASRAHRHRESPRAFHGEEGHLTPEHVGDVSLWHAQPGVFLARALVASLSRDESARAHAVDSFIAALRVRGESLDVTHGIAGSLLGYALLVETALDGRERRRLQVAGERALDALWSLLGRQPGLRDAGNELNVGVAHGWGGLLYATLRWCEVTSARVAQRVKRRLDDLAGIAEPFGRGVRWPWLVHGVPFAARELYAPGWCNGSAGLVPLWLLAHRLTGARRYGDLALGSAHHAWESEVDAGPHLCCGRSGQAFAMLAMFQATGAGEWLERAHTLAQRALDARPLWNDGQGARRPESLYFGDVGIALLLAELEYPNEARMPLTSW